MLKYKMIILYTFLMKNERCVGTHWCFCINSDVNDYQNIMLINKSSYELLLQPHFWLLIYQQHYPITTLTIRHHNTVKAWVEQYHRLVNTIAWMKEEMP